MVSHTWVSFSPPIIQGPSAFQVELILQLLLACSKQASVHFFSGAESWFVTRRLISHVSAHCAAWNPRSGWSSVVIACMRRLGWHLFVLRVGFDACSCCAAVLSLASPRTNSRASTSVCGRSRLCSLSKSPEFSSNPRERISIVGVSESALDKITGCCSLWV